MSDNLYTKKAWQLITLKRKTQLSLTGFLLVGRQGLEPRTKGL